jgi:hypothetical protein
MSKVRSTFGMRTREELTSSTAMPALGWTTDLSRVVLVVAIKSLIFDFPERAGVMAVRGPGLGFGFGALGETWSLPLRAFTIFS